jgi:hypothetical protein
MKVSATDVEIMIGTSVPPVTEMISKARDLEYDVMLTFQVEP